MVRFREFLSTLKNNNFPDTELVFCNYCCKLKAVTFDTKNVSLIFSNDDNFLPINISILIAILSRKSFELYSDVTVRLLADEDNTSEMLEFIKIDKIKGGTQIILNTLI